MGIAFSSSLFGLAGSLVLGFLDLQAGQAQNRFYTELEDWLSTVTDVDAGATEARARRRSAEDLALALERLSRRRIDEGGGGQRAASHQAMANLAEGIQGLVQHMRTEQQMVRDWVEAQAAAREISDAEAGSLRAARPARGSADMPHRRSPAAATARTEYWPGFVDALSTLLLAFIFLLSIFVLAQFFLTGRFPARTRC